MKITFIRLLIIFILTLSLGTKASAMTYTENVIKSANHYLGTPYEFGAEYETSQKFDCSSFLSTIFKENGIWIPRTSKEQLLQGNLVVAVQDYEQFSTGFQKSSTGERLQFDSILQDIQTGDIIFFDAKDDGVEEIHHVAMYINEYTLLHATQSYGVNYSHFSEYWKNGIVAVKRFSKDSYEQKQNQIVNDSVMKYATSLIGAQQLPTLADVNETVLTTIDSSFFVQHVYHHSGLSLPRSSEEMLKIGTSLPLTEAKGGDLLFFDYDEDGKLDYVGLYVNPDSFLTSFQSKGVHVRELTTSRKDDIVDVKRLYYTEFY